MLERIKKFFDDDDKYRVYMRDSDTLCVEERVGAHPITYRFAYTSWSGYTVKANANFIISFDAIEVTDFTIELLYKGNSIATLEY